MRHLLAGIALTVALVGAVSAQTPDEQARAAYFEARLVTPSVPAAQAALAAAQAAEPTPGVRTRAALRLLTELAAQGGDMETAQIAAQTMRELNEALIPVYFTEAADGGMTHWPTGTTCPLTLAGFESLDVRMYNGLGSDVGCEWSSAETGMTVRLTITQLEGDATVSGISARTLRQLSSIYGGFPNFSARSENINIGGALSPLDAFAFDVATGDGTGMRLGTWITGWDGWTFKVRTELPIPLVEGGSSLMMEVRDYQAEQAAQMALALLHNTSHLDSCAARAAPPQAPNRPLSIRAAERALADASDVSLYQASRMQLAQAGYGCLRMGGILGDGAELMLASAPETAPALQVGGHQVTHIITAAGGETNPVIVLAVPSGPRQSPVITRLEAGRIQVLGIANAWTDEAIMLAAADALQVLPPGWQEVEIRDRP